MPAYATKLALENFGVQKYTWHDNPSPIGRAHNREPSAIQGRGRPIKEPDCRPLVGIPLLATAIHTASDSVLWQQAIFCWHRLLTISAIAMTNVD
jgi:hypothetical protein